MKYLTRISQRTSYVVAEIYYMSDKYKSEISVNSKYFGSSFRNTPREKDFINARKWLYDQMELLSKYSS